MTARDNVYDFEFESIVDGWKRRNMRKTNKKSNKLLGRVIYFVFIYVAATVSSYELSLRSAIHIFRWVWYC